jgi:transposase
MSRKRRDDAGGPGAKRDRRVFTDEFKQEAVRLLHEQRSAGGTLAQVARELDLGPDLLRSWIQKYTARDEATGAPAGVVETPEQELRRLRRENAVLRQEREFAKKVAVYFAKESR